MIPASEREKTVHALDRADTVIGYLTGRHSKCIVTYMSVTRDGVLDWWSDLLNSLTQRATTLYNSLLRTHTSVHSHVFTSRYAVAATNGGRSPSSGFSSYPRPQLPASKSNNSSQLIPPVISLTHYLFTYWLSSLLIGWHDYNTTTRITQKTPFLCCSLPAVA
jgi:hypothetical protein